ncbi:tRNA (cytosine(38)-C(5))-methyltransferase [Bombyx mandarina]|uniref:tRNA (cytosine(38)-C(5))-methyltransferase n=1 Tax=Bombyx mandarina TaxID=7092 RepID=A0A6J2JJE0_BOMMA|nr:tRNA (cytosine(38)-C(5))-methyltransferase [Bombyx mandarina]
MEEKMEHRILELYSGIGGMHCAWNESTIKGKVVAAIDINTVANDVYKYNFPETLLFTKNIQSLTPIEMEKYKIDTVLMSPPCQPFTRNGKNLDENDPRTNSFLYFIDILDKLNTLQYILMENVKGFECSTVRNLFVEKLTYCGFVYQEFMLSPVSVGVPNSRLRYYCIAKRNNTWNFKRKDELITCLPKTFAKPHCLKDIIENNVPDDYLVPDKMLRKANIFDICYADSNRSCCFTKAYTHYVEGTGSVFTETSYDIVQKYLKLANYFEVGSDEFLQTLKKLKLRFFTSKEILRLMSFPSEYSFPTTVTRKQCYRLLGNSVNVKVISELLQILFDE